MLIRPETDGTWSWVDSGHVDSGPLTELAAAARGRPVVLAVPGSGVTLTTARAPQRNRRAWRQALPYALEDQLASEVGTLHIALADATASGPTAVAVIADEPLAGWLAMLRQHGLTVAAIHPDMLLLPLAANAWSLLADGAQVLVRTGAASGFVTETANLALLLGRALASADPAPASLRLWGELEPRPDAGVPWVMQEPAPPLAVLERGLANPPLDLQQGRHSPVGALAGWLRPWRSVALLAGLAIALQVGGQLLEYHRLGQARTRLENAEVQLYRQVDPTAKRILNPRAQLAGLLRSHASTADDNPGLLDLLRQAGAVLHGFPTLQLQALHFQNGELRLDLQGGTLETLQRLQGRLRSVSRLTAKLQVSQQDGTVAGRLILHGGPS